MLEVDDGNNGNHWMRTNNMLNVSGGARKMCWVKVLLLFVSVYGILATNMASSKKPVLVFSSKHKRCEEPVSDPGQRLNSYGSVLGYLWRTTD